MCRHFDMTGIEILHSEFGTQNWESKRGLGRIAAAEKKARRCCTDTRHRHPKQKHTPTMREREGENVFSQARLWRGGRTSPSAGLPASALAARDPHTARAYPRGTVGRPRSRPGPAGTCLRITTRHQLRLLCYCLARGLEPIV
jgi:hypothetical protein